MKCLLGVLIVLAVIAFADDEGTVTAMLKIDNGNFSLMRNVSNLRFDQTGTAADYGVQALTTATNDLNIANVTTPRYAFFRNLSTNRNVFVTLTMKLRAYDIAVLPVLSTNITAYVTNGTANIEYWINQE